MPTWRADLHVHTVLSGCAEEEMLPPLMVERCQEIGLRLLGVLDHNSAGNAQAMLEAAQGTGVVIKPGLEVETRETVHLVCLFDTPEQALSLQEVVYARLPSFPRAAAERSFGSQVLVDRQGLLVGYEHRPLFAATDLSLTEVAQAARERGGLVLAAHVERRAHGLLGVLGFPPPDLEVDGMEAGPGALLEGRVASSDAHRLVEIGSRYTLFEAEGTSVAELRESLRRGAFRSGMAV
jgi:3',5'-nucleoside bisphosphate phosphatase